MYKVEIASGLRAFGGRKGSLKNRGTNGEMGSFDKELNDGVDEEIVLSVGRSADERASHSQRDGDPKSTGGVLQDALNGLKE